MISDGEFAGVVMGMSNYDYHQSAHYWSSTQLKYLLATSPKHFYERYVAKSVEMPKVTQDLLLGSTCHGLLLAPDDFDNEFLVMPELNLRTKDDRAIRDQLIADNADKMVIKDDTYAEGLRIVEKVRGNTEAMSHLVGAKTEMAIFWICPFSGLKFRAKLDGWQSATKTLIEYKTASDGHPDQFTRQVDDLNYDLSLVHYAQGVRRHLSPEIAKYQFIVSETSEPYVAATYAAHDMMIEVGHSKWMSAVTALEQCLLTNVWPGYKALDDTIVPTTWALKKWGMLDKPMDSDGV